jgi:hypothetical protein
VAAERFGASCLALGAVVLWAASQWHAFQASMYTQELETNRWLGLTWVRHDVNGAAFSAACTSSSRAGPPLTRKTMPLLREPSLIPIAPGEKKCGMRLIARSCRACQ